MEQFPVVLGTFFLKHIRDTYAANDLLSVSIFGEDWRWLRAHQIIAADTVERLRSEIDSGQAGDKVDFGDPAAAPLGSDEEAAGTPPNRADIALARRQEVVGRPYARWTAGPILFASFITVLFIIALLLALKYS